MPSSNLDSLPRRALGVALGLGVVLALGVGVIAVAETMAPASEDGSADQAEISISGAGDVVPTAAEDSGLAVTGSPRAGDELLFPGPCDSGERFCCLDDWQGGGLCGPGERLASCCESACGGCGTFFCTSDGALCFQ